MAEKSIRFTLGSDSLFPLSYQRTTGSKTGITWDVIKFQEGLMIQYGKYAFSWSTATTLMTGTTGGIYTAAAQNAYYAVTFADTPTVIVRPSINGTVGTMSGYTRPLTNYCNIYVFSTSNITTATSCQVSILAIGRWK